MNPQEAFRKLHEKKMAKAKELQKIMEDAQEEAKRLEAREEKLLAIVECEENGHRWHIDLIEMRSKLQLEFVSLVCQDCEAFATLRTDHSLNGLLHINHPDGHDVLLQEYLDEGSEEE